MKKKVGIIIVIALAIIIAVATVCVICVTSRKKEDEKEYKEEVKSSKEKISINALDYDDLKEDEDVFIVLNEENNYKTITLSGKFSDNKVIDEEDALQELNEVKDILGISNVDKEFKFEMENGIKDYKNYRMQQYYEDIAVDGMQLIVSTDKDGNLESITGNYLKINNFETKPEIEENKLEEIIENEYGKEAEIESKDLLIEEIDEKQVLAWRCLVSGELEKLEDEAYYIHIDANNGNILEKESVVFEEGKEIEIAKNCTATVDGKSVEFTASKYKDRDEYVLCDCENAIIIYDKSGDKFETPNKNSWKDENAIIAYINLQKVYNYYYNNLGYDLTGKYPIQAKINIKMNNAECTISNKTIILEFGAGDNKLYKNYVRGLDVVGHELSHAYVELVLGGNFKGEINEGYADVLGCTIENYLNGTENDWKIADNVYSENKCRRDLENPELMNQPSVVGGEYYNNSLFADEHDNCTVLGHTAYLMHERGFTLEEIATIFAESCNILTKKAKYEDVGRGLIESAKKFTPDKIDTLEEILNEQNILKTITLKNSDLPNIKEQADKKFEESQKQPEEIQLKENQEQNEDSQPEENQEQTEKNQNTEKATFKIGEYEFPYGKYITEEVKLIGNDFVFAEITININPDGTYTYTSDNQAVSEDHSGTWSILEDAENYDYAIILENGNESEKYGVAGNNLFFGKGSSYLYPSD